MQIFPEKTFRNIQNLAPIPDICKDFLQFKLIFISFLSNTLEHYMACWNLKNASNLTGEEEWEENITPALTMFWHTMYNFHICENIWGGIKELPTLLMYLRYLSRMNSAIISKVCGEFKGFPTLLTCILSLFSMNNSVPNKTWRSTETLLTFLTCIRCLTTMDI